MHIYTYIYIYIYIYYIYIYIFIYIYKASGRGAELRRPARPARWRAAATLADRMARGSSVRGQTAAVSWLLAEVTLYGG